MLLSKTKETVVCDARLHKEGMAASVWRPAGVIRKFPQHRRSMQHRLVILMIWLQQEQQEQRQQQQQLSLNTISRRSNGSRCRYGSYL
jgi:hypothetical protein